MQLKQSLEEKVTILTTLDEKTLEKTPDEEVEEEIQQSDIFAERIQLTIIKLTKILGEIEKMSGGAIDTSTNRRTPSRSIYVPGTIKISNPDTSCDSSL